MNLSKNGLALLKKHEGFRAEPYLCPAKVWTIGYGTTRIDGEPVTKSQPKITERKATEYLLVDVGFAERAILRMVRVKLTQNQFDALVSLVYNIGVTAFRNSTLLRLLNENRMQEAATQFLRWVYADGVRVRGLINRRADEYELFTKK